MPTIDYRRHAERADRSDEASGLSAAGRATAIDIGRYSGMYALVVASPLVRAQQTAELIGGRVDHIELALLPDVAGIYDVPLYRSLDTLAGWSDLMQRNERVRVFADEHMRCLMSLGARVRPDDAVLAVGHGGTVELAAVHVAAALGVRIDGPAFGYCEGVRITCDVSAAREVELLRA